MNDDLNDTSIFESGKDMPTPQELAALATQIYAARLQQPGNQGEHSEQWKREYRERLISDSVYDALKIKEASWDALVAEEYFRTQPMEERIENLCHQPLKIGRHYLPRLALSLKCTFKEYLAQVVGLSKHSDRWKWFRDFLKESIRRDKIQDVLDREFGKKLVEPEQRKGGINYRTVGSGSGFLHERYELDEVLELVREMRFKNNGVLLAVYYRRWRVIKEFSPKNTYALHQLLEECSKKGLEHERKLKNGTSPDEAGSSSD